MGCDIHTNIERQKDGKWERLVFMPPIWDWRSYGLFGFLADVRNYSAVPPISARRGIPDDCHPRIAEDYEEDGDCHSASWLSVEELLTFDYDASMVDRRVTRQVSPNFWDGGCTGTVEEGEKMTFRAFLGEAYFADLERLRAAGATRVVFWFDN